MSADAIILPARENCRSAIIEASRMQRKPNCKMYTDGHRLAWLPRHLPGWFRIAATDVRDAYEQTAEFEGCLNGRSIGVTYKGLKAVDHCCVIVEKDL